MDSKVIRHGALGVFCHSSFEAHRLELAVNLLGGFWVRCDDCQGAYSLTIQPHILGITLHNKQLELHLCLRTVHAHNKAQHCQL